MLREDWTDLVREFERTPGVTMSEFARKHRVKVNTFSYQMKKHKTRRKPRKAGKRSAFVQVGAPEMMEISRGSVILKVPVTISAEALKLIVEALNE